MMKVSMFSGGGFPVFGPEMIVVPWIGEGPLPAAEVPGRQARLNLSALGDFELDDFVERHGAPLKKGKPLLVPIGQNQINQKTRVLLLFPLHEDRGGRITGHEVRRFAEGAVGWAIDQGCGSVGVLLDDIRAWTSEGTPIVEVLVEAASLALYRFDECRSKRAPLSPLNELVLIMEDEYPHLAINIESAQQIAEGIAFARDLILLPPNWKRPTQLAELIRKALLPFHDVPYLYVSEV